MPAIAATSAVIIVVCFRWVLVTPTIEGFVAAGAKVDALIAAGQWWRVVSAGSLHGSLTHLLMNCMMLGFAMFAWMWLVRDEGWSRAVLALALVVWTSTLAFVLSFVIGTDLPSVGASGAAHGMLAAIIVGVWVRRDALPAQVRRVGPLALTASFLVVIAVAATLPGADHAAHIGGAASGAALGYLVDAQPRTRGVIVGLALAVVVVALISAARSPGT